MADQDLHGVLRERPWFAPPYEIAEADLDHMLGFATIFREDVDTAPGGELIYYAQWACPLENAPELGCIAARGPITAEVAKAFMEGPARDAGFPRIVATSARTYRLLAKDGLPVEYDKRLQ